MEALRLARADKGLILWIDLTDPTPEETKAILELLFEFHPLAIEDCVTLSELPKIEDYEDYLFMIMHSVAISSEKMLKISELNLFLGKEFLVTYHREPIPGVTLLKERLTKGTAQQARGSTGWHIRSLIRLLIHICLWWKFSRRRWKMWRRRHYPE